jgi:hypothetical protein
MTEEEAKEKICPIIKFGDEMSFVKCYGSACMMWVNDKWTNKENQEKWPDGDCGLKQINV